MAHALELRYGLPASELLDAIDTRFRLRTAVEGAVAEVQMERKIKALVGKVIERYQAHDIDGHADFSIWLSGRKLPIRAECKNVRESSKAGGEAYRVKGVDVAYKVETQKTRAGTADPTSRFYDLDQFEILGVCLGKKTGCWSDIVFVKTGDLLRHKTHPTKLAVMQRVPLPEKTGGTPWFTDLANLLSTMR
jgi:hypothetical protein